MLSAPTREELLGKLARGDFSDSGGDYRLIVFNPDAERIKLAQSIVERGRPSRGTYDIWFSSTSLLTHGGKLAYVFPGFWDEVVTETDSLSDACGLPRMDQLIAQMRKADANGLYYQRRYNTKWLCQQALSNAGVTPDMYLGYSLGEWEAALFAGIITCDIDTWTENFSSGWDSYEYYYPLVLVDGANRQSIGRWCEEIPGLYLSIDNCPSQVILTGTKPALAALVKILDDNTIIHVVIPDRTALHTPLVADIPGDKFAIFADMEIQEGQIPVWSSTTLGTIPTSKEAYLAYLSTEIAKTVRFREAVAKLYEEQHVRLFIQIGPGPLPDYVADTLRGKEFGAIATSITSRDGADQLRRVLALLHVEGWHANPVAAAAYTTIRNVMSLEGRMASLRRDMVSINLEMARLFERLPGASGIPGAGVPGRKGMTFEETLTLAFADHPYLIDHCIVRQPEDWPVWEDMNPVVPFTMIIELFAETAMRHAPGEKLIKISNVIAFRWIEVDTPVDITVRGEWSSQETVRLTFEGHASAECTFAATFPQPDATLGANVDIGEEMMTPGAPEQWYGDLTFHGPQYRSVVRFDRICERGVSGVAENRGGRGSLLDAVGQMLGLYVHVTQTDNTVVFPISVRELDLYADIHDQEGVFDHTVIVTKLTDSSTAADAVVRRGGGVWCVMRGFVLQRFVSTPALWHVILDPRRTTLATKIAPGVWCYENTLHDNMLAMLAKRYLSKPEREHRDGLDSQKQKREYLISRIALKDAVRSWLADRDGDMMYPIEFDCVHDDGGQPCLRGYGRAAQRVENLHVSLSHRGGTAVATVSEHGLSWRRFLS